MIQMNWKRGRKLYVSSTLSFLHLHLTLPQVLLCFLTKHTASLNKQKLKGFFRRLFSMKLDEETDDGQLEGNEKEIFCKNNSVARNVIIHRPFLCYFILFLCISRIIYGLFMNFLTSLSSRDETTNFQLKIREGKIERRWMDIKSTLFINFSTNIHKIKHSNCCDEI